MQLWQLRRRVHVSWLIALWCGVFVIGVALVPGIDQVQFAGGVWLLLGIILGIVSLWRHRIYIMPVAVASGLMIGLWHGSLARSQLNVYTKLIGMTVTVQGTVTDDPDVGKSHEMLLRLGNVRIDGHAVAGSIWVSASGQNDIRRSDAVTVRGKLANGFGSFAAAMYRAQIAKVERPEPGDVARQVRDGFGDKVRQAIDEPEVSLGLGYLVGQRRALPPELDQALVIAGLTHVVVASGYNLTILVRFARRLFVKVSKYLATLAASGMVLSFVAITGASPSMTRAGIVSGLSLAAWYYGRAFHPLVLLPFAATITVALNPSYAWNDLGWQLSFAAFGGVMIVAPLLQRYFFGDTKPSALRQILGETIAASIVTLPILVLAFGQFSNVALIANLLILPLVPLAMVLTFAAGVGVIVAPALTHIVGLPAQWLLGYMVHVAEYIAGLSWAQTTITIQPWMAWLSYVVIGCVCLYLWRATRFDLREANIVE